MDGRTFIFCGENETEAEKLLTKLRSRDIGGMLVSSFYYDFERPEPIARAIIMPDVPGFIAEQIFQAYPGKAERIELDEKPPAPQRPLAEILAEINTEHAIPAPPKRRGRPPKNRTGV